ncbi:ribonuclease H-like domain-containing protein [Tanacetum coccineum]
MPGPTSTSARINGPTLIPRQATTLPHAFVVGTLHDPSSGAWNMDTGASSHLNDSVTNLSDVFNSCMYPSVSVGDGHSIPVTNTGHSILPTSVRPLHLNNVLITPNIVKNLISVRQFVRDNNCTVEFDAFGFSVKDFMTRRVLLRCDSTGDLYPVTAPSPIPHAFLVSQHTWHQRLGHPGGDVLRRLVSSKFISCNNEKPPVLCHACQLGKHVRLPFASSNTVVTSCFDIIHSDVWTSPIPSLSGFKYYVLFLDHYSQFVWVYPLHNKSDVWSKFVLFRTYVRTQFKCEIRSLQCDHGVEFDNRLFLSQKKYAVEILEKAHMVNCNPSRTPVDAESKLGVDSDPVSDPTLYRSLAGSLQYLTFTRPDLSYAVQQVCLHMHDPREPYFSALKRILRYVQCTLHYGLQLFSSSATDLVAYSDADWDGVEAEYRGVANAVAETCWLRNLLLQHQRTKHIEIDIHFVRDLVAGGQVRVLHVSSRYQFADIFTKGLPSSLFEEFRFSLSVSKKAFSYDPVNVLSMDGCFGKWGTNQRGSSALGIGDVTPLSIPFGTILCSSNGRETTSIRTQKEAAGTDSQTHEQTKLTQVAHEAIKVRQLRFKLGKKLHKK